MQGSWQINISKAPCLIIYVIALTQTGQPIYFLECDRKGRWLLGRTAFDESYGITAEQPRHFGYGFGRTLAIIRLMVSRDFENARLSSGVESW